MNTVLLLDDDDELRALISRKLKSADLLVFEAPDGNVGLSLFRDHKPDLVITDLAMPHKDGIETIAEILALDPQMPIIAMSGGRTNRSDAFGRALELGAVAALEKPFHLSQLLDAVTRALDKTNQS